MARTNRSGLGPSEVDALDRAINPKTGERYTTRDIAEQYDVTEQYVSWIRTTYKVGNRRALTPRAEARERHWLWGVITDGQSKAEPARRLADHLEYAYSGAEGWSDVKWQKLVRFYKKVMKFDLVVEFHPNIEPYEGMACGGWKYRHRIPDDGDLLVRLNDYTRELNEADRYAWMLPDIVERIPSVVR